MNADELPMFGVDHNASDLYLQTGAIPSLRIDGQVREIKAPLTDKQVRELVQAMAPSGAPTLSPPSSKPDLHAAEQLLPLEYDELRKLATHRLAQVRVRAAAIAAFTFLFGAALFPNLITSSEGAAYSL
jgi:hypothetical protein